MYGFTRIIHCDALASIKMALRDAEIEIHNPGANRAAGIDVIDTINKSIELIDHARNDQVLGRLIGQLQLIQDALDDALGDTDITHMDDDDLRENHPIQWAMERLAEIINEID